MEEADIYKTAVAMPFGRFEILRIAFGLRKAAQAFQRFIDEVFQGKNSEQHNKHLEQVCERLSFHGLIK